MAHPITDSLVGKTPEERHAIKAAAFCALTDQTGRQIKRGQYTLTILDGPRMTGNVFEVSVRIERGGTDITPPLLNPVRVWNPPILVPDPAGDVVESGTNRLGQFWERRYREDVPGALLEILRDLFEQQVVGR